jgi:hypothetical protein
VNVETVGRVQALQAEAERLREQAGRFDAQGLPWAASVCRYEADRNDEAAARETGGIGAPVPVTERPVSLATVTLTPAEWTVPWWLPLAILAALLIVAAGLGLLASHIAHGGI